MSSKKGMTILEKDWEDTASWDSERPWELGAIRVDEVIAVAPPEPEEKIA